MPGRRRSAGAWPRLSCGMDFERLEPLRLAEVRWYEAYGIGRRALKVKQYLG